MTADVSFSPKDSPGFVADEGSTTSDDYLTFSSNEVHFGSSSRPELPFILSPNALTKSLPRLPTDSVSKGPSHCPSAPSIQQADCHLTFHHQRSPLPPHLPHAAPVSIRQVSGFPSRDSDRHGRRHDNWVDSQDDRDDRRYDQHKDCFLYPPWECKDAEVNREKYKAKYARSLTGVYPELRRQQRLSFIIVNKAQSQRERVRELSRIKDEADQKFMAAARAFVEDKPQSEHLLRLFNAMQDTRVDYDSAEKRLEEITAEMDHDQVDIYSEAENFRITAAGASGKAPIEIGVGHQESSLDDDVNVTLYGITGDRPELVHPLHENWKEALAELQLAMELLTNTCMKRKVLHAQKIQPLAESSFDVFKEYGDVGRRKALELRKMAQMTEDDYEQLREYDELQRRAQREIQVCIERLCLLERKCQESGASPPSYSSTAYELLSLYFKDVIHLDRGPSDIIDESTTLAHPYFPLLLSNPTHVLHDFPQTALQSLQTAIQLPPDSPGRARKIDEAAREVNMGSLLSNIESDDRSEFINRWLLHKLHSSAMEAELLWTTFRSNLTILDIDRWQRDVLYFWWRDHLTDATPEVVKNNGTDKTVEGVHQGAKLSMPSCSDSREMGFLKCWNSDEAYGH